MENNRKKKSICHTQFLKDPRRPNVALIILATMSTWPSAQILADRAPFVMVRPLLVLIVLSTPFTSTYKMMNFGTQISNVYICGFIKPHCFLYMCVLWDVYCISCMLGYFVCICIQYIYVCMDMCTQVSMYIYMQVGSYTCMCGCGYVGRHLWMYVCM